MPPCSSAPRAESCASSSMPRASRPIRRRTSRCCRATCSSIRCLRFDRRRRWLLIVRGGWPGGRRRDRPQQQRRRLEPARLRRPGPLDRSCTTASRICWWQLGGQVLLERFDDGARERPCGHAEQRRCRPSLWEGLAISRVARSWSRVPGRRRERPSPASAVTTAAPTTLVTVGAPYAHEVEPMAAVVPGRRGHQPRSALPAGPDGVSPAGHRRHAGRHRRRPARCCHSAARCRRPVLWRRRPCAPRAGAAGCASRPGGSPRTTRRLCTILSVTSEIMGNT